MERSGGLDSNRPAETLDNVVCGPAGWCLQPHPVQAEQPRDAYA